MPPGTWCDGKPTNGNLTSRESKAFCEGLSARYASNAPVNPHAALSDAGVAWQRGVDVAAAAAGGAVAAADAPCCAVPAGTVPA